MATIPGTSGSDTLFGTPDNDTINGFDAPDLISGEGADDLIDGGSGNDTIYGDAGVGTAPGQDASPLILSSSNLVSDTSSGNNNAQIGDTAIYNNVAVLEDGTLVSGRLIFVSTTNANLNVDISGPNGAEILLNSGSGKVPAGAEATFRLEFFETVSGEPVSLNSVSTFNDLDRNSPGDQESVTIDAGSFTSFATSSDTSLAVSQSGGVVNAAGTEPNSPSDQDAWFSASFENREFLEFTLETRSTQSGFSMSGDLIDDSIVTPVEAGNDTIIGGLGADLIFGQGGNDSIVGGTGNDTMDGGEGTDTLVSGEGNDEVQGGAGSDLFTFDGTGNHTIVGGEDADGLDVDVIDLTGIRSTVTQTGAETGTIDFEDATGAVTHTVEYSEIEQVIICFAKGTQIATARGERAVETIKPRDRVITRDNGIQMVRWVGKRKLDAIDLAQNPELAPISIGRGALGNGLPERDLVVSPSHRVLITSERAMMLFGESEVLIAAKFLLDLDGIERVETDSVEYIHIMFDRHEMVLSDGAWSESFQPGVYSLDGVQDAQRNEIFKLFPSLKNKRGIDAFDAARRSLKRHEAALFLTN